MDIVEFLRARLDEDERAARAAFWDASGDSAGWRLQRGAGHYAFVVMDGLDDRVVIVDEPEASDREGVAVHIVRHDPARVLREVEAKRRLLDLHRPDSDDRPECGTCGPRHPCSTLRLLALPYADHDDYREEWTP